MKQLHRLTFCTFVLALTIMGSTAYAGGFGNNIAVRLVGTDAELFDGTQLFEDFGFKEIRFF